MPLTTVENGPRTWECWPTVGANARDNRSEQAEDPLHDPRGHVGGARQVDARPRGVVGAQGAPLVGGDVGALAQRRGGGEGSQVDAFEAPPGQVRALGAHEVDRGVGQGALDQVHVRADQILDLALPGVAVLVGGDRSERADDVGVVAHVGGEHVPALPQRLVGQDDLRGRQARDVPALRRGGRGHRVGGKRGAERGVGNEGNRLVQHQGGVDLVGEHEGVVVGDHVVQGAQLVLAQDSADRVPRVAQDNEAGPGLEPGADPLQVERPPVAPGARAAQRGNLDDGVVELARNRQERHVGGRWHDDRGARAHQVIDRRLERGQDRGHEANLRCVNVPAEATLLELGGGARDARLQPGRLVAEQAVVDRSLHRVGHLRCRPEVHFRHPRADRWFTARGRDAGPFQGTGAVEVGVGKESNGHGVLLDESVDAARADPGDATRVSAVPPRVAARPPIKQMQQPPLE